MSNYNTMRKLTNAYEGNPYYNEKTYPRVEGFPMVEYGGVMFPRMLRADIKRLFPDRWIFYINPEQSGRDSLCTVISVCKNEDRHNETRRLYLLDASSIISERTRPL